MTHDDGKHEDDQSAVSITPTERALHELCKHSFLRFWTFPNPFRPDGRVSKELCDAHVICGPYVLAFSDKSIAFPDGSLVKPGQLNPGGLLSHIPPNWIYPLDSLMNYKQNTWQRIAGRLKGSDLGQLLPTLDNDLF